VKRSGSAAPHPAESRPGRPRGGFQRAEGLTAYRLLVEYDGSRFQGWQKQGPGQTAQGVRTVAGALERVLRDAGIPVADLGGSGRTDAGVHALGQVAHLRLGRGPGPDVRALQLVFDRGLPGDVAVRAVHGCSPGFHARHDAVSRSYLYQLSLRRTAFAKPYVWWVKGGLDLGRLREAWAAFQGNLDFSAFADLEPGEDPRARVLSCELATLDCLVLLRVTADHFLRRQVRRMVGAAVACALGKAGPEQVAADLAAPTAEANLAWGAAAAPASGLFLERVRYPGDPPETPLQAAVPVL
jgi:tRNA pseudouridine38-40 synthase